MAYSFGNRGDSLSGGNKTADRQSYGDYNKRGGDGYGNNLPHTDMKGRTSRLSDMQVLQEIDQAEDPKGRSAMRKIDFTRGGISVGRKEFLSKNEALKALEMSKTRVSEIM